MKWRGARSKTAFEWFEAQSLKKDIGDTNLENQCNKYRKEHKLTNTNKFV